MRSRARTVSTLFLAVLLLAATVGAPPLLPPSLSIRMQQNAVAVVTVLEVVDAENLRLRRDVVLQEDFAVEEAGGEPRAEIVVRVGEELAATVEPGERYILAYTSLAAVPKQKHTFSVDPEGARIFDIPSVGPALLEVSPALRTLVTPRPSDAELTSRQRLDLILEQVERADARGRRFVLAELMLWRDLAPALTEEDVERFRRVLESGELGAREREYFLRVFVPQHEKWGSDWLAEASRRVIAEFDPQLDLTTAGPALVKQALEALRQFGRPEDAARALEFLFSNNDAVSLAALGAGAALDPARTEDVIEELVWDGDLPRDTNVEAARFLAERQAARKGVEDQG